MYIKICPRNTSEDPADNLPQKRVYLGVDSRVFCESRVRVGNTDLDANSRSVE